MDGVSKGQLRGLTALGAVVGLAAGFFAFDRVINDRMIEAPRFVLATFVGGAVAMLLYVLIKDGGCAVLRKQAARSAKATDAPVAPPAPAPAVEDEDEYEDEEPAAPQRPLRAQRPLRRRE